MGAGGLVKALDVRSRVIFTNLYGGKTADVRTGQTAVVGISNRSDNLIRFEDGTTMWAHSTELEATE